MLRSCSTQYSVEPRVAACAVEPATPARTESATSTERIVFIVFSLRAPASGDVDPSLLAALCTRGRGHQFRIREGQARNTSGFDLDPVARDRGAELRLLPMPNPP